MKSAEDLFKYHCDRYTGSGWLMREHHFTKALSEHDSEIMEILEQELGSNKKTIPKLKKIKSLLNLNKNLARHLNERI